MVDPIGAKPVRSPGDSISPVSAAASAPEVAAVADEREAQQQTATVAETARRAAEAPPVDHERVAVLRAAIANGNYRPAPQTIADKMIGAMQEWIAR